MVNNMDDIPDSGRWVHGEVSYLQKRKNLRRIYGATSVGIQNLSRSFMSALEYVKSVAVKGHAREVRKNNG